MNKCFSFFVLSIVKFNFVKPKFRTHHIICSRYKDSMYTQAESLSSPEILTNDAKVGPSYAIQFEIAASCDNFEKYGSQNWDQSWDSLVFLEYSLDYGGVISLK